MWTQRINASNEFSRFDSMQYMESFNWKIRLTRINDVLSKISLHIGSPDRADM